MLFSLFWAVAWGCSQFGFGVVAPGLLQLVGAELGASDLARHRLGQLRHELHQARVLVRRRPLLDMLLLPPLQSLPCVRVRWCVCRVRCVRW